MGVSNSPDSQSNMDDTLTTYPPPHARELQKGPEFQKNPTHLSHSPRSWVNANAHGTPCKLQLKSISTSTKDAFEIRTSSNEIASESPAIYK